MPVTISESPTVESFKSAWANMVEAIEPDIDILPEPWRSSFEGPIRLLIGSKISLGIIPERRMWAFIEKANFIYTLIKYPDFVNYDLDYITIHIGEFFTMLGLGMSIDGRFLLEGPMSRQFVSQTSKVMQMGYDRKGHMRPVQGGVYRNE